MDFGKWEEAPRVEVGAEPKERGEDTAASTSSHQAFYLSA